MPSEHNVAEQPQQQSPFPQGQPLPPPTAMYGYPPNYHGPPGNYPPPHDGPQYYGKPFYILPPPSGLPMYHPMQQMYGHPPPPPPPSNGPMPSEEPQPVVESTKQTKRKRQTQPPHYEVLELKTNSKGQTKRQKNANKVNDEDHCECDQVGGRMECDACGASYAHPKCLAKHRWDRHMDRWSMVEGMLEMNKQQQVQAMEAAQILVDIASYGMRVM